MLPLTDPLPPSPSLPPPLTVSPQPPSDSQSSDDHQQMIRELLASGKPVFMVEEWCEARRRAQLEEEQERLKKKILSYNRKEKSLEELSRKFIQNFEEGREILLELDIVTLQLRVERRRIYDIVNIYESLQVVRKSAKNIYVWRGLKEAVKTIRTLANLNSALLPYHPTNQKSLENLATRFLNLFVTHSMPVTLQEAAKLLLHNHDSALVKTKIRRLYDIVNVFKSLGLVEKVHLANKKPGFRWMGTECLEKIIEEKKRACREATDDRQSLEVGKQNRRELLNNHNVNQWFSAEQRKAFSALGFMKEFSQKVFLPSIILREGSAQSLPEVAASLNDMSSQY